MVWVFLRSLSLLEPETLTTWTPAPTKAERPIPSDFLTLFRRTTERLRTISESLLIWSRRDWKKSEKSHGIIMMARGIPSVAVLIINEASLIRKSLWEYSRSTATLKSWKISFISQNIGKWQENVWIVLKKRQKTLTLSK